MKAAEKAKAQIVLNRIQRGTFDQLDVDHLFTYLRPYCGEHWVFRDIADLVAHPDARNKGLANKSLEAFYLSIKFLVEYAFQEKKLDPTKPIPLYIKKLMKYQVEKCDPEELRRDFNVTPERLKSRIDNYFKDDKKSKTTELQHHKVGGAQGFAPIGHLLSFIGSVPAFTADELMLELLGVMISNNLEFDEQSLTSQRSAIILCVMLLMHHTNHEFDVDATGSCEIHTERSHIDKGMAPEDFGELQVMGTVNVPDPSGGSLRWSFPIFESGLQAAEYCDASLLVVYPDPNSPSQERMQLYLERGLRLLDGRKLGPLADE